MTNHEHDTIEPACIGPGDTYRRCLHIIESSHLTHITPHSGLAEFGGAPAIRKAAQKLRHIGMIGVRIAPQSLEEGQEKPVTIAGLGGYEGIRKAVLWGTERGLIVPADPCPGQVIY